jgi:endonuclease/exonuclease/phosphatase family metal-dependent hydrolase
VELQEAAERSKEAGLSGWQKAGLGALTALAVTTSIAGSVGLAARHLPLCEPESSVVEIQDGEICVSADLSTKVDAVHRSVRGELHRGDAIDDLSSQENRVLRPRSPASRAPDGELTVNSWNLHHGTSQNSTGARDQLDIQIQKLKESDADVDLLQEILPWHAQRLVDGTGKVGYYSQTTPRQGNLILVSPELVVTENARLTLNHDTRTARDAAEVVGKQSGLEPRAAQVLHLTGADTNGKTLAVFNTHLSTGSAAPQDREAEHQVLERLVEEHRGESDVLIGGGDLNTRDGEAIVQTFKDSGLRVEGARIDWLVADNVGESEVKRVDVKTAEGVYVSDHPLVEGRYQIPAQS